MREGFDKEIDSLLRRTARAPTSARGNGTHQVEPDTHLDADELAAFAEGALPEVARMSAVSHLADCTECRALAINLTRAAGVEAKLEKSAAAVAAAASPARESKPARGWLAALFAPRTFRYVAPALVVCLVAAVSFIALRSRSGNGLISLRDLKNETARPSVATTQNSAQQPSEETLNANTSANANAAPTATVEEHLRNDESKAEMPAATAHSKDAEADAPDGAATSAPAESKTAEDAAAPPPPPASKEGYAGGGAPPEVAKTAPVEEQPAPKSGENMKGGPPPKQVQNTDELASNNEPQAQKRAASPPRNYEPQSPDGSRNQQRGLSNSANNSVSNSASGGALAGRARDDSDSRESRDRAPSARRKASGQDAASESERTNTAEESRAVAGHRFRRDGGAWVDVNYKSTMSSTGVRRGTDAYRALVADIPEIGRVAEQLGGEVFVVVRGRAYHIR